MSDENINNTTESSKDSISESIEAEVKKMQQQFMQLGVRTICEAVLNLINQTVNKPGKTSLNDYKRLTKHLIDLCNNGIAWEPKDKSTDETTQN